MVQFKVTVDLRSSKQSFVSEQTKLRFELQVLPWTRFFLNHAHRFFEYSLIQGNHEVQSFSFTGGFLILTLAPIQKNMLPLS